jgi:Biopolymer transport proteins
MADASILQWLAAGGLFIWPILLCSLVALALVLERLWFFWRTRLRYESFIERLRRDLRLCPLKRPGLGGDQFGAGRPDHRDLL